MRHAFVMGSNGPADNNLSPLRYAHQDAERMKACLSGARCSFIVAMPEPGTDVFEVRRQLTFVAESCTPDDTFVCYFSGHGILEKGALFLLWENTLLDRLLGTALPVSEIMQVLKYCRASSRLLILDCCHAGTVVTMLGLKDAAGVPVQELEIRPDNYFVLMASDRLERARELETLQGSFLTTKIKEALEEKFVEADKDKDGRISMQDLHRWLEDQAAIHNRLSPSTKVSYPYILGKQKGEFFLTLAASAWVPYELDWPDGNTMVVLPIFPNKLPHWGDVAVCIGKYPVTNAQYKRFIEASGGNEPVGKHFRLHKSKFLSKSKSYKSELPLRRKVRGSWQNSFYPWREDKFWDPNKPIVCVSYYDAVEYCAWVGRLRGDDEIESMYSHTMLPTSPLWDFAAFGTAFPSHQPGTWLTQSQMLHHNSLASAPIDLTGTRSNARGISDMFGNVWEWCLGVRDIGPVKVFSQKDFQEIRGGGFLDDLSEVVPFLSAHMLEDRVGTRHSDLGFRIAGMVDVKYLPQDVRLRLYHCEHVKVL